MTHEERQRWINRLILDAEQLDVMARTVWGEARGEEFLGQVAVAHVILNRTIDQQRWPHSPADVCRQRLQFSCWNQNDPNYQHVAGQFDYTDPIRRRCLQAVLDSLTEEDNTDGANHYHALSIAPPSWTAEMTQTCEIGNHRFYRG